ncbi:uncharacterized protein [Malus domestica]|uniref:uncharacterized protein n=1 Tax=Malus domestica TaxID=3750 RepID=UPI003974CE02
MGTNQSHNFKCWSSIYGSVEMVVGRIKGAQPLFSHTGRYLQAYAFNAYGIAFPLVLLEDSRLIQDSRLVLAGASRVFSATSKYSAAPLRLSKVWSLLLMDNPGVEELVVHLDRSLDLSTMEIGVKLVGKALTQKSLNRWGIRNILNSAWKDLGEVGIKWVRENLFIISVPDQSMAQMILAQVPWAVMKKNFVVKAWPPDLALEEVDMKTVPFWLEDPVKARGFLRARVLVHSENPLVPGCWLKREENRETWVEFRYERLQDFCYHCGRIDHINTECSYAANKGGAEGYGDWIKAPPVRDVVASVRPSRLGVGEMRTAGMVRGSDRPELRLQSPIRRVTPSRQDTTRDTAGEHGSHTRDKKKWRRVQRQTRPASQIQVVVPQLCRQLRWECDGAGGESLGTKVSISQQCSGLVRHEVGGVKRGVEPPGMELVPSPQKKTQGPNPEAGRQVLYDGTMDARGLWDHVEAVSSETKGSVLAVCAGSDTAVRALHGLIRNQRPSMIFLSETKMKDHRLDGVRRRLGFHYGVNVSPVGRAGGLSLWWDDSVEVQTLFSSKNIIDVIMRNDGDGKWVRVTGVYGTPYREDKAEFWEWMSSYFSPSDIPWLCAGDFNEFLWDHEKSGGVEVLYNWPRYLENFMQATNLWDLDFNGPTFTWHGMRHGHWVEERIDRALINGLWQDLWPESLVTHGTVMGSDHCPLILQTDSTGAGEVLVKWTKKINDCKSSLIRWSRNKFKKRSQMIQELLLQLQELQRDWRSNCDVIKQKMQLVDDLRAQEESYWMQRSRVRWLREGDANTSFFHSSTLHRRRRNQIIKIKDEFGHWVEQPSRVRKLVDDHFMQTFTSGGARIWGSLLDCISPRVTEDMNQALLSPVTEDEVKSAIFKMGGLKAPGPDGFQGIFYQSFWEHVFADVCTLVRELMQRSRSPAALNATCIVLIPKVPHPESVSQFRPISLCNYSYKVLSKVLAN